MVKYPRFGLTRMLRPSADNFWKIWSSNIESEIGENGEKVAYTRFIVSSQILCSNLDTFYNIDIGHCQYSIILIVLIGKPMRQNKSRNIIHLKTFQIYSFLAKYMNRP